LIVRVLEGAIVVAKDFGWLDDGELNDRSLIDSGFAWNFGRQVLID
jgi:hypothetical protein